MKINLVLILFLSYLNLSSQSYDKSWCNYEYKDYKHYASSLIERFEELTPLLISNDSTEISRCYQRIASNYFCKDLDINLDSISKYLILSKDYDPNIICEIHSKMLELKNNKPDMFTYYVSNINDILPRSILGDCSKGVNIKSNIELRKVYQTLLDNDQKYRSEWYDFEEIGEDEKYKQYKLDSINQGLILHLNPIDQNCNIKEKEVIFLILIHAKYDFIENNSDFIDIFLTSGNVDMQDFVIDRYYCNKFNNSPIGNYCITDSDLLKDFELLFPLYYKHYKEITDANKR